MIKLASTNKPTPEWPQRKDWILQMLNIYTACHAKKVLIRDIALRNLLLADDYTIRAIDFAQSEMFQLESTGELRDDQGYTEMTEVFNVTNAIYSLSRWVKFEHEINTKDEWPDLRDLPSTVGLPLGGVIAQSWSGQFKTLDQLRQAVVFALSEEKMPEEVRSEELVTS